MNNYLKGVIISKYGNGIFDISNKNMHIFKHEPSGLALQYIKEIEDNFSLFKIIDRGVFGTPMRNCATLISNGSIDLILTNVEDVYAVKKDDIEQFRRDLKVPKKYNKFNL